MSLSLKAAMQWSGKGKRRQDCQAACSAGVRTSPACTPDVNPSALSELRRSCVNAQHFTVLL